MGKAVRGLEFFVFSLVSVNERKAYPLLVKQTIRSESEKSALSGRKKPNKKSAKKSPRKLRGRPPGVLNKDKTKLALSNELLRLNQMLKVILKLVRVFVRVKHLALDGHFGHNQAVLLAKDNDLDLISKLRKDAALFEKYKGEQPSRGRRRRYGEKLDYQKLPPVYLKKSEYSKDVVTNYYQGIFVHKSFAAELNVVIIEKINLQTEKLAHAILFSSDLGLSWERLIEYYSLRFQIEFNFRDAKQHFGLEDFMTTSETGVENAANLSFLMVNLSSKLLQQSAGFCVGINDLKSQYRGVKYAIETIKLIQPKAEMILIERVKETISRIGSIHRQNFSVSSV